MNRILPAIAFFLLAASLTYADDTKFAAADKSGASHGATSLESSDPAVTEADLKRYVTRLTSAEFEGRGTGDPGEQMATAYLAAFLEGLDLAPAGDDATFYQKFSFRAGMELKGNNSLSIEGAGDEVQNLELGKSYQPLSLSTSGNFEGEAVFGGFGIEHEDYSSFKGLDIKDKWLLLLRGHPGDRDDLKRFAPLVAKAKLAKAKGATGILFIKAAGSASGPELIPPTIGVGADDSILPAMTISDELAKKLFVDESGNSELLQLFKEYNEQKKTVGYPLPFRIKSEVGLAVDTDYGRNVLGRLVVGEKPSKQVVVIGGHIDHLGYGNRGGSRAKGDNAKKLHPGADDNASGIAVIMELAQLFADQKKAGTLKLDRDIIFAGWSGEEVGLWGSRHYIKEARKVSDKKVYPGVAAYLNLDMVGRASKDGLTLNGTASSKAWQSVMDSITANPDLKLNPKPNPYVPSDASAFYMAGVPILAAFTGTHDDYHTPRDTVDKIDFPGLSHITHYMKDLATAVSNRPEAPDFVQVPRNQGGGAAPKVKIGIRMETVNIDGKDTGIRITQVLKESAAEQAGLKKDDVITSLNTKEVAGLSDLFSTLRKMKPNTEYPITIIRDKESLNLKISPQPK